MTASLGAHEPLWSWLGHREKASRRLSRAGKAGVGDLVDRAGAQLMGCGSSTPAPHPQPGGSVARRHGGGHPRVSVTWPALPRALGAPSPSQVSLSPSRYKAWESQPREIRSQFQPVPTERSYQDGTCRMEYFKLYLSPDRGRLIAAPSLGCGGGAGREVAAPPATPFRPLGGHPLQAGPPVLQPRRGGPARRQRLDYGALGTQRGGRGAG